MSGTRYILGSFLLLCCCSVSVRCECTVALSGCANCSVTNTTTLTITAATGSDGCTVTGNFCASENTGADENTENKKFLVLLIALTVLTLINTIFLAVVIIILAIRNKKKISEMKLFEPRRPSTNINDAYGILDMNNGEDAYSNQDYSVVDPPETEVQRLSTANLLPPNTNPSSKDEDVYSNHGYSMVEPAGTEAQRLSTANLLPQSDDDDFEYSYTHMRFPAPKLGEKQRSGGKDDKAGKKEGSGEKDDKSNKKASAAEGEKAKGGSDKFHRTSGYTKVVIISKSEAKNSSSEDPKAATPSKDSKSSEPAASSKDIPKQQNQKSAGPTSSYGAASNFKKDSKPTKLTASAAVSKKEGNPKPAVSKTSSASFFKRKKNQKSTESTSSAAKLTKNDEKPTQPTASHGQEVRSLGPKEKETLAKNRVSLLTLEFENLQPEKETKGGGAAGEK